MRSWSTLEVPPRSLYVTWTAASCRRWRRPYSSFCTAVSSCPWAAASPESLFEILWLSELLWHITGVRGLKGVTGDLGDLGSDKVALLPNNWVNFRGVTGVEGSGCDAANPVTDALLEKWRRFGMRKNLVSLRSSVPRNSTPAWSISVIV
mmetsp:Transcript_86289/g.258870  ORF Transcript_86289/g.258870 Transcript_86289/m.258870 type:complete len:150 (+) Transcript_86289:309-758(+)